MYSEIYVKQNVKEQFDSKYLDKLGLTKEDFNGQKYDYPGEATEFLYMDELKKTFKTWLFCEFGEDFYIMDSNDGSFEFESAEMDWSGNEIRATGDLILIKKAYQRCIEYCQELSHMETFAQRNFLRAIYEEELFDKYDIVVVIHYN